MSIPADVSAYLGQHSHSDEAVIDALAAETAAQLAVCKVPVEIPVDLRQALLRRVLRNLAMRSLPLGVQQDELSGGIRMGSTDPEVRRLESPYRKRFVA